MKGGGRKGGRERETEGEGISLTLDSEFGKTDLVAVQRVDEEMSKSRGKETLGETFRVLSHLVCLRINWRVYKNIDC